MGFTEVGIEKLRSPKGPPRFQGSQAAAGTFFVSLRLEDPLRQNIVGIIPD